MIYEELIKYGLISIGSIIFSSYALESKMKDYNKSIDKPVDTVSIIIPSYNEELFIEKTVKSIRNQDIIRMYPDYFEIILVDNGSTDKSIELAKPYVDKVIISKRGKLTARNLATDNAKGNIIVAVDSDCEYPNGWLNTLLEPFKYNDVVATTGSIIDYDIPYIPGQIHSIASVIHKCVFFPNQLYGGNCAYRKDIFYKIGKFNENINQTNLESMFLEEETGFGDKIAQYGKVEYVLNAACIHHGGFKVGCRMKTSEEKACELAGIGKTRF